MYLIGWLPEYIKKKNILINDVELMQDATDMNKIHFERKSLIMRLQAGILQQVFKREELSSTWAKCQVMSRLPRHPEAHKHSRIGLPYFIFFLTKNFHSGGFFKFMAMPWLLAICFSLKVLHILMAQRMKENGVYKLTFKMSQKFWTTETRRKTCLKSQAELHTHKTSRGTSV